MNTDKYQSALVSRYTSKEMQHIFSDDYKFRTWRKCWTALAEAQKELGIKSITSEMIAELRNAQNTIDYDVVKKKEDEIRHDVMAHIHEYGTHCPTAKGIIHLGATSQFVGCNTDLIQMREATKIIRRDLVNVIYNMAEIAEKYKNLATLGYTHGQSAQPTTIGKRFTLYIQDLLLDLDYVEQLKFKARGAKGATGTQAGFLELFDGDADKVLRLDEIVSKKLGFEESYPVTGQTYPRKFDTKVIEALAGIGVSLTKFATDIRIMSHNKIVDEPFQKYQTGSSAMPYKRNPMRSERLCSIARKLTSQVQIFYEVAENQWFERTLDDSAVRRMSIPEGFLSAEAILRIANNVTNQNTDPEKVRPLTFYPKRIKKLLDEEIPFLSTEKILVALAKKGFDRNEMHEIIKEHSVQAGLMIKEEGKENDLFERLAADTNFPLNLEALETYKKHPELLVGLATMQTEKYLRTHVTPALKERKELLDKNIVDLKV